MTAPSVTIAAGYLSRLNMTMVATNTAVVIHASTVNVDSLQRPD
jgi:hypothetical protein